VHDNSIGHNLDQALVSLPSEYVISGRGEARFVIGPRGAFVLLPTGTGDRDIADAAHHLQELTVSTRDALCRHLSWVPFLDGLLVAATAPPRHAGVTIAPVDLVRVVLTEGPEAIDLATLNAVRAAIRTGSLGPWKMGVAADDRIDLCDPIDSPSRLPSRR
jgi:hypothetical protein